MDNKVAIAKIYTERVCTIKGCCDSFDYCYPVVIAQQLGIAIAQVMTKGIPCAHINEDECPMCGGLVCYDCEPEHYDYCSEEEITGES